MMFVYDIVSRGEGNDQPISQLFWGNLRKSEIKQLVNSGSDDALKGQIFVGSMTIV
jgi:hypothetical protein